jgi:formylglycine-generating enzyme required for sulfatase activity
VLAQANCDPGNRQLISASAGNLQPIAGARPLPVQSFAANPRGLYQIHGNVYDWVEDKMTVTTERHQTVQPG